MCEAEVDARSGLDRALRSRTIESRVPYHLSGGEKRKVALASVLALNPEAICFDEPMGGLDPRTKRRSRDLIASLNAAGKTLICATHDFEYVDGVLQARGRRCRGTAAWSATDPTTRSWATGIPRGHEYPLKAEHMTIEEKRSRLGRSLEATGRSAVAFSGGADSSFLCAAARAGARREAVAVTVVSPMLPGSELADAREVAAWSGIRHVLVEAGEIEEEVASNPKDRCYHCKRREFGSIADAARELGVEIVLDGTNVDDEGDYRPGMRALAELGVASPLRQAGLTKGGDTRTFPARRTADLRKAGLRLPGFADTLRRAHRRRQAGSRREGRGVPAVPGLQAIPRPQPWGPRAHRGRSGGEAQAVLRSSDGLHGRRLRILRLPVLLPGSRGLSAGQSQ